MNFKRTYTKNQRKINETKAGLVKISRKLINVQINWSKEKTQIANAAAAAAAKSLQSCPTLCDPIDGSPPGSPVPGILQARTLEWAAISFSDAWKWKVKVKSLSRVRLFATPWTAAYQAPPSMGFSRQEYWSGVPLPSPKLPISGTKQQSSSADHAGSRRIRDYYKDLYSFPNWQPRKMEKFIERHRLPNWIKWKK